MTEKKNEKAATNTTAKQEPKAETPKPSLKDQVAAAKADRPATPAATAPEKKEKAPKAEKAPAAPVEPKKIETQVFKLVEGKKAEDFKGQRKMMVEAFLKVGKPVHAEALVDVVDKNISKQNLLPVVRYHCLKMLEDGILIEVGKIEIEATPRKAKKADTAPVQVNAPTTPAEPAAAEQPKA